MHTIIPLTGRCLLSAIFVLSGIGKLTAFEGTVSYIAGAGLPVPQLLGLGAIAIELVGSAMLILGWKTRWAASAMLAYTAATALFFHAFWAAPADQVQNQMIHFMKNISMIGGFLYVLAFGAGPWSLDAARASVRRPRTELSG